VASRPKTLPPTLRERERYIAYEIISEEPVDFGEFISSFYQSLFNLVGELGASEVNAWVIRDDWDQERQRGIIKCDHRHVNETRVALALITHVGNTMVIVRTLGISGTLKGARKKYFGERDLTDYQKSEE